jgi:Ca-activated chloride channel family protein
MPRSMLPSPRPARPPRGPLPFALLALAVLAAGAACRIERQAGDAAASPAAPPPDRAVKILFTYGSEKEDWIQAVTAEFNGRRARVASGKTIFVEAVPEGSGESIEELLAGNQKADLTSPASAVFLRLGNAQSRARTGRDLVGETRNLVLSPVVIAMWKPMAEAIGWGREPIGWANILALAKEPRGWGARGHAEWGPFRFGHTHPDYSNSGLIALLAETYAAAGKVAGLTLADVARPAIAPYVAGIESAVVHYGSSTGFFGKRMWSDGPGYLSAAVLYENMVIGSTAPQYHLPFPVVAVYPKEGTFWSDHPVGIVEREWVSPEHREAAQAYIDYLLARPQQELAMQYGFRPAAVEVPLAAPIDAAHGVDPKQPQTTLEVPPVEVVEAVRQLFRRTKKHADVTLVLDTSGSMNDEGKIGNAREGAVELVTLLDDADTFSLLPFNNRLDWAVTDAALASARGEALAHLRGLFASGGTALYDAISEAYDHNREAALRQPGQISAVVVLTDGEDTNSSLRLEQLLAKIRADREGGGIRVFTIGYGREARADVLERIADASRAKFYAGNPGNIRAVFREISTFF